MTSDVSENRPAEGRERLDEERLSLSRARAELARKRYETAEALLVALVESRPAIAARAKIQLARLCDLRQRNTRASELLAESSDLIYTQLTSCRERLEGRANPASRDVVRELDAETMDCREALLELARAWARLGHPANAREAYADLLREADVGDVRTLAARHIFALADYRLGELLVDEVPAEAYYHWRRAFETGDEHVSPYAALKMATQVGDELVTGRVERLFHHAMGSSDPRLFAEAALGLAQHLKVKRQFGEARRYLIMVAENEGDPARSGEALDRLENLDRAEATAPRQPRFGRDRALQARVKAESERSPHHDRRVIVVGAGTGGDYLLESLDLNRYEVCGFVDDGARDFHTYPVLGGIDELGGIIGKHRPDEVLLAIPTLAGSRRRAVVKACRDTDTPLLNLPRMYELGIGWTLKETRRRLMTQLRPVEVEELIGDRRVEIDALATSWLQYETVVVVGAGALGAELCRRLADGDVGRLVVIDRRQSALRKISGELADSREFYGLEAIVGDATESGWLAEAFQERAPALVFNTTGHSAAPALDPSQPVCSLDGGQSVVRNEVLAAAAVAGAAVRARVPRTLHACSRRAGVSREPFEAMKALSEEIVLWHAAAQPGSVQAVVRIGQLLDSRHGRLARVKQQIQTGAKVTIPGPCARVRFMATARWAELALHAARLASNGDLLEPDGGEEIRIKDVVEEAIRLRDWYPEEHVLIDESSSENWDDPPSPEPRRARDPELGLYALDRAPANDRTLRDAVETCAALVKEYQGGSGKQPRDALAEIADSWLSLVGGPTPYEPTTS